MIAQDRQRIVGIYTETMHGAILIINVVEKEMVFSTVIYHVMMDKCSMRPLILVLLNQLVLFVSVTDKVVHITGYGFIVNSQI